MERRRDRPLPQRGVGGEVRNRDQPASHGEPIGQRLRQLPRVEAGDPIVGDPLQCDREIGLHQPVGVSLPVFFTGLLLVYVFYFQLGWAPAPIGRLDAFATAPPQITGFYLIDSLLTGEFETFRASLSQLILPALTLCIFSVAPIARMTRASMLAALASEFVRTARASGLDARKVIITYAFRNAMLPVVTTLGMVFSFLLGANVLVEKVFAWPGVGSYAVEALLQSDFAPVQGFVLTMAVLYVALNLLIDILYGVIDPRVRLEG
jgi:peptide/nickel transport system permease protein